MNSSGGRIALQAAIFCAALVTTTGIADAAGAPPVPPPAEAFGRLPAVQYMAISPNGRLLATDRTLSGGSKVAVWEIGTGKALRVVDIDAANKLRGLAWADDETVLVNVSIQHEMQCSYNRKCNYEWLRTLAVPMDGTRPRVMLMDSVTRQWVTGANVLAVHGGQPHSITMQTWDFSRTRLEQTTGSRVARSDRDMSGWTSVVFEVDTTTGKGRELATGTPYTYQWVVDAHGQPVARSEWQATTGEFTIVVREAARWREIYRKTDRNQLELPGLAPDGKSIVALGSMGTDRSKAWRVPLDGSGMQLLFEDANGDVDSSITDPYTNAVVAVQSAGKMPSIHWLDPQRGSQQRSLSSAFPGRRVVVADRSADGQRIVAIVDSPSQPDVYQLVDFATSRADIVGEAYPELAKVAFGEVRFYSYLARDGADIPTYLTLPPGSDGRNLPLIVLPHGGPESRDYDHFDWLAQFLATRGYAVLQPQFRGSTGFGEAHRRAGYRQWGGRMQDDLTDGVRHLVANGTADPTRVCIVGGSYGGYAALAGAAFTPELYACAASINGISDLPDFVMAKKRQSGEDSDSVAYWADHIGPAMDPNVAAKSPARSAGTVRANVLLMHGIDDSVVPLSQSEKMANALTSAGKPVTFVKMAREDHWLSRSDTRVQVLKELETFLARHLH